MGHYAGEMDESLMTPKPKYQHEFATPLEAAEYSLKRASEVAFQPISGQPQLDPPPPGDLIHGWPDQDSRDSFAFALLTDAVGHVIAHLKEKP